MEPSVRAKIGETFKLSDGVQVVPTNIPVTESPPGGVGDTITIHSKSGRTESSRIGAIEYVLMAAGGEFYAIFLDGADIRDFRAFTDGEFQVEPRPNEEI